MLFYYLLNKKIYGVIASVFCVLFVTMQTCVAPRCEFKASYTVARHCKLKRVCRFHLNTLYGLDVRPSNIPHAGYGLFATRRFNKGDLVSEYFGKIIRKPKATDPYVVEIVNNNGASVYVTARKKKESDVCRYVNDPYGRVMTDKEKKRSKYRPNVEVSNNLTRCKGKRKGYAFADMVATKRVNIDDELFYEYGNRYWEEAGDDTDSEDEDDLDPPESGYPAGIKSNRGWCSKKSRRYFKSSTCLSMQQLRTILRHIKEYLIEQVYKGVADKKSVEPQVIELQQRLGPFARQGGLDEDNPNNHMGKEGLWQTIVSVLKIPDKDIPTKQKKVKQLRKMKSSSVRAMRKKFAPKKQSN